MKGSPPYRITRSADTDLVEIWQFVARRSFHSADKLIDELTTVFTTLSDQLLMGEVFDLERQFMRRFVVGEYVVYYSTDTDPITILRVLHGARDSSQLL